MAITQTMALSGMVQWGMRQSAEISNQLTSVERVLEYTEMETEKNLESAPLEKENEKKLDSWPSEGKIEFKNMFFYYKEGQPPAIKDLCVTIKPAEKVRITEIFFDIFTVWRRFFQILKSLFHCYRLESSAVPVPGNPL